MIDYLFIAALALFLLASLPLWGKALQRVRRSNGTTAEAFLSPRSPIQSPIGLVDVLLAFLMWTVCQGIALSLTMQLMNISQSDLNAPTANQQLTILAGLSLGQLMSGGFSFIWLALRYGHLSQMFGAKLSDLTADLKVATCTFIMILPTLLLLQFLLSLLVEYRHGTIELLRDQKSLLAITVTWIAAVIIAPLTEEIFFRGFLQSWLQRLRFTGKHLFSNHSMIGGFSTATQQPTNASPPRKSNLSQSQLQDKQLKDPTAIDDSKPGWLPIILTSAAFAAVHLGQGLAPVILFLFSIVLGYLYRQTGSLRVCVVLHMLLNGYSMFWVTLDLYISPPS